MSQLWRGALEASTKLVADVAPNQQRDKGADLGLAKFRCDSGEAFVHLAQVESVCELLVDLVSDVQQVGVDLESTRGVGRCRTRHAHSLVFAWHTKRALGAS